MKAQEETRTSLEVLTVLSELRDAKELLLPPQCLDLFLSMRALLWPLVKPKIVNRGSKTTSSTIQMDRSKLNSTVGNPEVSTPGYEEDSRATSVIGTRKNYKHLESSILLNFLVGQQSQGTGSADVKQILLC